MMKSIKSFFSKLIPSKRKIIQLYAALLYNANIKGFVTGEIFTGNSKSACLPGLNCYSCPGAIGACPLGSLQNALAESKTKLPTYILGIILLYSIILGRTICGFLCPVGLLQELLYKIKTPKLKKNKVTRVLSYFKYVLLFVLVIILPLIYALQSKNLPLPAFCKYVCPAGTFEGAIFLLSNPNNTDFFGMLGSLFTWKFLLLVLFAVGSVFIFRLFCRFICPLGAIYGLFNKLAILGVKVDKNKCNHCQACINHCKMDVKEVGDHECIQCGECMNVCHCNAISWKTLNKIVKEEVKNEEIQEVNNDEVIEQKASNDKRINKKTFNIITSITALFVLIVTLIVVNFPQKLYSINDICDDLKITTTDSTFDITKDNKSTMLYFYQELTEEDLENIKLYADGNLNIILISNSDIASDVIEELKNSNIMFSKDDKIIKLFNKDKTYPYSVFLDSNDKILIMNNNLITNKEYSTIVYPCITGKTVGYEVGDICINKDINLIGSNETFSVADNLGKITVINFWFTSCTPCVKELPFFNKIAEEYSDDVTVLAIHYGEMYDSNPQHVVDFVNNQFNGYEILFGYDDSSSPYALALGDIRTWPTTFIVDENGLISFVNVGSLTEERLRTEIEKLLD